MRKFYDLLCTWLQASGAVGGCWCVPALFLCGAGAVRGVLSTGYQQKGTRHMRRGHLRSCCCEVSSVVCLSLKLCCGGGEGGGGGHGERERERERERLSPGLY